MRLAVIDCGTNTFNLIIINLSENGRYEKLFNTRVPVKLGEASINQHEITPLAFKRGLSAFTSFNKSIKKFKVEKILTFATSAIRDATNGKEFTQRIKKDFNVDVHVIDGYKEAELIYLGIQEAVKMDKKVSLIMDIGGGSTEFILASGERIYWKGSFNIGAARLLQRFQPSDPITKEEVGAINKYLDEQLKTLFEAAKKAPPQDLIGSSGAFESLIEMIHSELGGEPFTSEKTEYTVGLSHHKKIADLIINSTLKERKKLKSLVPMRQDMIVIFCIMLNFVLHKFKFNKLRVSAYSLKEGAVVDFINNGKK